MAGSTRSDLFVPDVMADAVRGALAGRLALDGTGAFNIVDGLPDSARAGDTVNVPYFGHIGDFESRTDGQALTVVKITSAEETAVVVRTGKAFEITNWGQQAAAGDPYAEGSRQMADGAIRAMDRAALTAALTTTLTLDRKSAQLGYEHFVDLLDLFGDEQEDVVAFAGHSKLLASLRKLKDTAGRPLLIDATKDSRPMILGRPMFISDRNTAIADGGGSGVDTYKLLALKRGAGVLWRADGPRFDTDKDILADSKVAAANLYYAPHLYKKYPGQTKQGVAALEVQA